MQQTQASCVAAHSTRMARVHGTRRRRGRSLLAAGLATVGSSLAGMVALGVGPSVAQTSPAAANLASDAGVRGEMGGNPWQRSEEHPGDRSAERPRDGRMDESRKKSGEDPWRWSAGGPRKYVAELPSAGATLPTAAASARTATHGASDGQARTVRAGTPELASVDLLAAGDKDVRRYGDVLAAHGRWCAIAAPTDGDDALSRASVVIGSFEFEAAAIETGHTRTLDGAISSSGRRAWRGPVDRHRLDSAPAHRTEARPAPRASSSSSRHQGFAAEARPRFVIEHEARDRSRGEHFGCALAVLDLEHGGSTPGLESDLGSVRGLCAVGADRAAAAEPLCGAVDLFLLRTDSHDGDMDASWTFDARVSPASARAGDAFGASVALGRGFAPLLAVGAPSRDLGTVFDAGRVHVFARRDAPSEPPSSAATGIFPAAPVAADAAERAAPSRRGRHEARWIELAVIDPPQPAIGTRFGTTVALHGDLLAIGAPEARSGALQACGVVHLYRVTSSGCVHLGAIEPPRPQPWLWFGAALALDERLLVVGSPGASASAAAERTGAVHVYELCQLLEAGSVESATPWTIVPEGLRQADSFGQSVALHEGWLAVGAPGIDPPRDPDKPEPTVEDAGAARLLDVATRPADRQGMPDAWSLMAPEPGPMALFGASCAIAIAGGTGAAGPVPILLVGHRYLEEESSAPSAGAVVFIPP